MAPPWRTVEQRVDLRLLADALLPVAQQLRFEDGVLRLRLEDVLLRRPAHRVPRLGNLQEVVQQFLVALHELLGNARVVQFVVRHLEAPHHVQPDAQVLLEFRVGLFARDLAAQFPLPWKRYFLRHHNAGVARSLAPDSGHRPRTSIRGVPERHRRVRQGARLFRTLARRLIALLRHQDFTVIAQRFRYQRVE